MKRTLPLLALLIFGANPALAAPGGYLHVLLGGAWVCETQGDATAPPVPKPQDSFQVIADSSYRTGNGAIGTYLLLGNDLAMTSGPFRGRRYKLTGLGILHPADNAGKQAEARCVHHAGGSAPDGGTGDN